MNCLKPNPDFVSSHLEADGQAFQQEHPHFSFVMIGYIIQLKLGFPSGCAGCMFCKETRSKQYGFDI